MASNRHLGMQEVEVGEDLYLFKANFKLIQDLKETNSSDPMKIYETFSTGACDVDAVVDILSCSIYSINDKPVSGSEKIIEELINQFGIQECWMLCFRLLSDAMIGNVKKSELQMDEKIQQLRKSRNFLFTSLRKQPFSWMYQVWIFGVCLWVSFKHISLLFT